MIIFKICNLIDLFKHFTYGYDIRHIFGEISAKHSTVVIIIYELHMVLESNILKSFFSDDLHYILSPA